MTAPARARARVYDCQAAQSFHAFSTSTVPCRCCLVPGPFWSRRTLRRGYPVVTAQHKEDAKGNQVLMLDQVRRG